MAKNKLSAKASTSRLAFWRIKSTLMAAWLIQRRYLRDIGDLIDWKSLCLRTFNRWLGISKRF